MILPTRSADLRVARQKLRRRRLAVLYGGWSAERPISLKSGAAVRGALKRLGLPHAGIDVRPDVAQELRRRRVDLAFLAVHGPFGEDGALQGLLDVLGVPYTGSGVRASALAMHKPSAKQIFDSCGLPTPDWFCVRRGEKRATPSLKTPWVVKPASQGSALGVSVVRRASQWGPALRRALALDSEALVERFAPGTEITVAVLDGRALPVVEIVPKHAFYDFYSKYAKGGSRHLVPARLPAAMLRRASELAVKAFHALGCRHFARVDFMAPRRGAPALLEVNTLPGMTATSLFPDAARAAGLGFDELVLTLLSLALADAESSKG